MKSENLLRFFLCAYIISLGFNNVLNLPVVERKVQPPEIIFVVLCGVWLYHYRHRLNEIISFEYTLYPALLAWLGAVFISALFANETKSWLEFIGIIYLIIVFHVFRTSFKSMPGLHKDIWTFFGFCGIAASFFGIAGWVLTRMGTDTTLAWSANMYYPYLGYIGRAKGFTTTPNLLVSLLSVCWLLQCSKMMALPLVKTREKVLLAFISIGLLLTFSKTLLLLLIGRFFIWFHSKKVNSPRYKKLGYLFCALVFVVLMAGTHVLVLSKNSNSIGQLEKLSYGPSKPFYETDKHYFLITSYTILKKTGVMAGLENFPFGVGPGWHNMYLAKLKSEGRIQSYIFDYDPHCTYTGTFGEIGIFGLLVLIYLFFQIYQYIKEALKQLSGMQRAFVIGIAACFLVAALEGFTSDIMNFRHYWVLLGIFGAIDFKVKPLSPQTPPPIPSQSASLAPPPTNG